VSHSAAPSPRATASSALNTPNTSRTTPARLIAGTAARNSKAILSTGNPLAVAGTATAVEVGGISVFNVFVFFFS
jgi:hypothetical protein